MGRPEDEWPEQFREDCARLRAMPCPGLRDYLAQHWHAPGDREYVLSIMIDKQCEEAVPYLVRQLWARGAHARAQAIVGLSKLGRRETRSLIVEMQRRDRSPLVRREALVWLSGMYEGERDREILRLALDSFDDAKSSVASRVFAGAAMMLQLGPPKDLGQPGWWNGDKEDLEHPAILWAVAETRRILDSEGETDPGERTSAR